MLLALLALFTAAAASFAQDLPEDAYCRTEFAAGRLRSAKASFAKALRLVDRPDSRAAVLTNLGQTLVALGDLSAAEKVLREASGLAPESPQPRHLLGQTLLLKGHTREAEAELRQAAAMAVTQPALAHSIDSDLATLLLDTGRARDAAGILERGIARSAPGQARARMLTNLGSLCARERRKQEAVDLLAQALAEMETAVGPRHPDVARVLEVYAAALAKAGRRNESRELASRARDLQKAFGWQANTGGAAVDWRDLL